MQPRRRGDPSPRGCSPDATRAVVEASPRRGGAGAGGGGGLGRSFGGFVGCLSRERLCVNYWSSCEIPSTSCNMLVQQNPRRCDARAQPRLTNTLARRRPASNRSGLSRASHPTARSPPQPQPRHERAGLGCAQLEEGWPHRNTNPVCPEPPPSIQAPTLPAPPSYPELPPYHMT